MNKLLWFLFNCFIALCAWTIHAADGYGPVGNFLWCIVDWLFSPIVFLYWLCTHQLTLPVIKATFAWFW